MAVTLAAFKARFPEFADKATESPAFAQAYLDAAASRHVELDVWGSEAKADEATMYLAAHLLAQSPYGQQARLVAKDGTTTYGEEYKRLQRIAASGFRAIVSSTIWDPDV